MQTDHSLDTTIFDLSNANCIAFPDLLIESWGIDLATLCIEIVLYRLVMPGHHRTFEFMERRGPDRPSGEKLGMMERLQDPFLSGDVTEEELAFLLTLTLEKKRPTLLYYYREIQSLGDPLHLQTSDKTTSSRKHRSATLLFSQHTYRSRAGPSPTQ